MMEEVEMVVMYLMRVGVPGTRRAEGKWGRETKAVAMCLCSAARARGEQGR